MSTATLMIFIIALFSTVSAENRALLVGIGKYDTRQTGWSVLHGDRDIDMLSNALLGNGYKKENLKCLKNEQATKAAIIKALKELAAQCRPGDRVFFHFSGHGQPISDLNGEELAALDLHGADLLTLIACDTGNGDVDQEEGILGLRRALKMAGCNTLVTTAWNLDKEAADAYLREFYTNLIKGSGISAAHRKAQLELLKRFDNPYYWAVFQLID